MSEAIKKHQFAATRIQFEDVTTPSVCENPQNKWAEWGEDNDYFNYVIRMYNSSVTNAAIINTITTWIEGGGLNASDKDRDIIGYNKFLNKFKEDAIEKFIEDFKLQGNAAFQIIWSKGEPKVAASFYHMPIQYLRPELADENGDINHYYYSENWQELRKKQFRPVPYPVFDGQYKGADIEVLVLKQYKAGLTYFGAPDYISSMRWIEIEGAVSEFHLSNIHNGFAPSVIVSFNNGIPSTQEEIHETETSLKRKFGGEGNAGKFIVTFADSRDQGVEVTTVPTNDLDKQYEFVSSHARQMIITGHKVTSPMLLGIKEDTGLGNNADEIKNATLLFQSTVIQGFQKQILKAIKILAKAENANFDFYFIPYTPIQFQVDEVKQVLAPTQIDKPATAQVIAPEQAAVSEDVIQKDTSYNGAQIASALEIVQQVSQGLLTKSQGIIFLMEFLKIDEALANKIFSEIEGGSTTFSKIKKLLFGDNVTDMTDSDEQEWLDYLKGKGELKEDFEQDYDLVSEEDASDDEEVFIKSFNQMNFAVADYAEPNKRSKEADSGLYSLRYQYSKNISKDSRTFCKEMVTASKAGVIFRYEDIATMSDAGVNGQFAPSGKSNYSIFKYKGGVYCRHSWKRLIFKRKTDEKGRIMPASTTKEMENDIRVGNNPYVKKKGIEGTPTNDLPNRGSLKYS